ncbi:MAG: DUF2267 domain-containing protein [Myxococcales bacterium]|nr:DUF2267 domain-containing protein [Myxococcales bacterium]
MTDPSKPAHFLSRVKVLTGTPVEAEVTRVAGAVLAVLAEQLPQDQRRTFAGHVGWDLDPATLSRAPLVADTLDALYARVADREDAPSGLALEHTQAVCRALAETLSGDARIWLASRLSSELATLLEPRPPPNVPDVDHHPAHARSTLAEGRPGSSHPLSEAAPETAHSESIARAREPHRDSKLSSSEGLTQERERETLARGRPDADKR